MMRSCDFFFVLILTSLTGSLCTFVWFMIQPVLERKGFLQISGVILKVLSLAWLFPGVYIILRMINYRYGWRWGGDLFWPTPFWIKASNVFFVIWLVGFLLFIFRYVLIWTRLRGLNLFSSPCEEEKERLFEQICTESGIEGVLLRKIDGLQSPIVFGIRRQLVILPGRNYRMEELEVVFRHELTHVKNKDLSFKHISYLIRSLYWFHPFAWWYEHLLNIWCEYCCDMDVCVQLHSMKDYFGVILNMVPTKQWNATLLSSLVERKSSLRKRVEHVKRAHKGKNHSRFIAFALTSVIIVLCISSVSAASLVVADSITELSRKTEVTSREFIHCQPSQYREPNVDSSSLLLAGEKEPVIQKDGYLAGNISWEVGIGVRKAISGLNLKKGQKVFIGLKVSPSARYVNVGLARDGDMSRYVTIDGEIAHCFEVEESGKYSIYLKNNSSSVITAEGTYLIYE